MHEDDRVDELDSLIDQALASYGAEPSANLEAKIILVSSAKWAGKESGCATVAQAKQYSAEIGHPDGIRLRLLFSASLGKGLARG